MHGVLNNIRHEQLRVEIGTLVKQRPNKVDEQHFRQIIVIDAGTFHAFQHIRYISADFRDGKSDDERFQYIQYRHGYAQKDGSKKLHFIKFEVVPYPKQRFFVHFFHASSSLLIWEDAIS